MDMTAIALTLASTQALSSVGPSPSAQESESTLVPPALSPTLSWTSSLVKETSTSLSQAARALTYMANETSPLLDSTEAGPRTPLRENRTTVTASSRPSKSGTITSSSHHPLSSASSPESFTKPPPTSSPTLLHVTHKPSGHSTARSSVFVTSGPRAVPESSSRTPRKPPQSSFISPKSISVTTVKSTPSCPAVTSTHLISNIPHVFMSHGLPRSTGHGLPSQVSCAPTRVSPITATSLTQGTAAPSSSGTPGTFQGTHITISSTVTVTPELTFLTPGSVTGMVVGRLTSSAPPFVTSAELTTLADGTVVSVTQAIANPAQDASGSLARHSFFEDHLLVISIFTISGMAIAFILVLALIYCRRRRRQRQRRRRELEVISAPVLQNPVTMREHASPPGGLDGGSVRSGNQPVLMRSSSSIPLNRCEEGMPATNAIINTPLPLPPPPSLQQQQPIRNRLSHRVPVPYAGLGARGSDSRPTDQQYVSPFSDNPPLPVQGVQKNTTSSVPPPPPKRSPLRSLATKNDPKTPQENTQRLSGASSLSLYPPSSYPSEAEVDSLYKRETSVFQSRDTSDSSTRGPSSGNNSGMEQRKEKASKNSQFTVLGGVDSWKWGIQP